MQAVEIMLMASYLKSEKIAIDSTHVFVPVLTHNLVFIQSIYTNCKSHIVHVYIKIVYSGSVHKNSHTCIYTMGILKVCT